MHTHTHLHRGQKQFQETSRMLAFGWCDWLKNAWWALNKHLKYLYFYKF